MYASIRLQLIATNQPRKPRTRNRRRAPQIPERFGESSFLTIRAGWLTGPGQAAMGTRRQDNRLADFTLKLPRHLSEKRLRVLRSHRPAVDRPLLRFALNPETSFPFDSPSLLTFRSASSSHQTRARAVRLKAEILDPAHGKIESATADQVIIPLATLQESSKPMPLCLRRRTSSPHIQSMVACRSRTWIGLSTAVKPCSSVAP